ncbi:hypothetical protein WHR41_03855 [Cladosporium halotolerans]|uniref:Leucine rich repeat domain-containing protein n=1 Tax=Cladosporium halotolerans TaxID=1052096 RepID=A0AB34KR67_9PEZI
MDSEDGQVFVKNLAYFVRTHERALANALQLQRQRNKNGQTQSSSSKAAASSTSSTYTLADALSRPYLSFASQNVKPAKLTLTPHHLYYLLTKFDDLGVDVGPMNIRLENIHADVPPSNYVSFLGNAPKSRGRQSDADSLKSVSSVRSVMSSMSSMWSSFTLSNSVAKQEKQMAQFRDDIKYLYSCFTKIPALRLSPDHRAHLISGFEEFPFDAAVPLFVFKNLGALEVCDLDFRQFYGWDRLAEQVRSLTVRRANVDDPIDLLLNIVLDDMDKRRRRSSRAPMPTTPSTSGLPWPTASPKAKYAELARSFSTPNSPLVDQRRISIAGSPQSISLSKQGSSDGKKTSVPKARQRSNSPGRPVSSRHGSLQRGHRSGTPKLRRSSGSDSSSTHDMSPRHSTSDLLGMTILPSSKWRFLRHLSLAENGLFALSAASFAPVAGTLQSLDLSGNLFYDIPDALASLTHLRALNLSNCMIGNVQTLAHSPLPAITTLNLRSNRLQSLSGIEKLYSLERIDVRDNKLRDPTELARLTGIPDIIDVYVAKNPFTRTHSNHRVTIFNLFRSTPGHSQDITIDSQGPLSHEKKQLVDRVPEPVARPVIKPESESEEDSSVPGATHDPFTTTTEDKTPMPPQSPPSYGHRRHTSDLGPRHSLRKKKAPRRRIVELSQAEIPPPPQLDISDPEPRPQLVEVPPRPESESEEPTTPDAPNYTTAPATQTRTLPPTPTRPHLGTSFSTPTATPRIRDPSDDDDEDDLSPPARSPQPALPDAGGAAPAAAAPELYKAKIESLKSELGPNWLSALSEDRFAVGAAAAAAAAAAEERSRNRSFSPASRSSTVRPEAGRRGVSVSGRTLG